jgi:hypothetical protein
MSQNLKKGLRLRSYFKIAGGPADCAGDSDIILKLRVGLNSTLQNLFVR